ncbi:MAG: hypothetical protein IPL87_00490 [Candidatus Moraniibacteriota bacterium]|nr:MAG: hypothetical protein IPL87_00490 [Candidatus Moranbacteria bacterium]
MKPTPKFSRRIFDRAFLASQGIVASGVLLLLLFPQESAAQKLLVSFSALFLLPVLFLRLIAKESLLDFGLSWGKRGWVVNIFLLCAHLAFFVSVCFILFSWTEAGKALVANPKNIEWQRSFSAFLVTTLFLTWFLFLKEFFFRGFFLLTWKRKFGTWALLAHALLILVVGFFEHRTLSGSGGNFSLLITFLWSSLSASIVFITESVFLSFCFSFFSAILLSVLAMMIS